MNATGTGTGTKKKFVVHTTKPSPLNIDTGKNDDRLGGEYTSQHDPIRFPSFTDDDSKESQSRRESRRKSVDQSISRAKKKMFKGKVQEDVKSCYSFIYNKLKHQEICHTFIR